MVDRCVCHDVTFAELWAIAQRTGADHAGLAARTGCGTGCGCCKPYVRLMLRTGDVVFPVLSATRITTLGLDRDPEESPA